MEKKKRKPWVPVVTGIIKKEDKVLVGIRPESGNLAGLWEFPGGKLEPEETPEEAIARELNEELGLDVEDGELLFAASHDYEEVGILLLFYSIPFWKGTPRALHHTEIDWKPIDELKLLEMPEANKKLLPRILQYLERI